MLAFKQAAGAFHGLTARILHPHAVALHFVRDGQFAMGLSPAKLRPY